jgi:formylglycine-generating enzyme required for sulfatase activity
LNNSNGLTATGGGYERGWDAANWNNDVAPTNADLACNPYFATWTSTVGSQENLPINCVNWYEAYAFCIWDGGFLPSEAEWEYAAAGGSEQREYPWGSTDPGTGNQYAIHGDGTGGCDYPSTSVCLGVANIAPVGTATLGAGLWGQLDLAGEVTEWNLDTWDLYVDPCTDCANFTQAGEQASRGSDFHASIPPAPARADGFALGRDPFAGVRCSRAP